MRATPRYFPPNASAPSSSLAVARPVFKVRRSRDQGKRVLPLPPPMPRLDAEIELAVHEALDHLDELFRQTETLTSASVIPLAEEATLPTPSIREREQCVLDAMDHLDSLFSDSRIILPSRPLSASPVVTAPEAPARPPAEPTSNKVITLVLMGLMGLAMALAAGCALADLRLARATADLRAHPPLSQANLTPVMQGYLVRAENGDRVAMRMMAFCYQEGVDTASNAHEAARWQFQAAQAGHPGFRSLGAAQLAQIRP